MKKILFTAVSTLALAAFADGVNSTEFGVLYVQSSAKDTIVSVPWLESGTGEANVAVSNLVLTAGLYNGDTLTLYNGSDYAASWYFNGTKWVKEDGDANTIPRGNALMLTRPDDGHRAAGFYIMGKPAELEPGSKVSLAAPTTKGALAYSLVAPPKTEGVTLASLTFTGLKATKDCVIVSDSDGKIKLYNWSGSGWVDSKGTAVSVTIPAGQGFWFQSSDSTGTAKSVQWN